MAEQKYLVGTVNEKRDVERLLFKNLPGNVSFEYAYLCNSLIERLYDNGSRTVEDFEATVAEYLYEFQTELQERTKLYKNEFEEYLEDIKNAIGVFKCYLWRIDCFPLPEFMKAEEGTFGTCLLLTVRM
ncbi:MAG TPA: hypothetical protein VF905_09935 [Nitrospirota bacterium]